MKLSKKTRNRTLVAVATLSFIVLTLLIVLKVEGVSITGFAGQEINPESGQSNVLLQGLGPINLDIPQLPPMPEIQDEDLDSGISYSENNFVYGSGRGGSGGGGNPFFNPPIINNSNSSNSSNQTQGPVPWGYRLMWRSQYFELKRNGIPQIYGSEYQGRVRFNLERANKMISDFYINFDNVSDDVNLSNVFGDSDFTTGKSFLHHEGELENISLYVPVKPDDVAIVICSNASSYDDIYYGCSELPHITNEEVLYLPHPRVTLSSSGLYHIVSGITGTGVMGANVSVLNSSSANATAPGEDPNAIAGNVTELTFPGGGSGVTQSWQGYFGNITGVIMLADGNDNILYNWSLASPEGVILASTNNSIYWNHIQCFNFSAVGDYTDESGQGGTTSQYGTNLTQLEEFYNIGPGDMDGVDETFTLSGGGTHNAFYINNKEFSEGECRNTRVFSDAGLGEDDKFEEALLYEPITHSVVFAGLMVNDVVGFDNNPHDFEMLVLEDGHDSDTDTSTYYFYTQMY